MRFLPAVILILALFAAQNYAQTEVVVQTFETGVVAAQSGRYEKALQSFRLALEKSKFSTELPDKFLARINYNVGVCHFRLNRPAESVAYFESALALANNKYPQAFHALGLAHVELENWRAAKEAFLSAVELNKSAGESWFDLALVYLKEKDFARAAVAFQKAVRFKSADSAAAHNNLGVIAAMNNDWARAEKEFETALARSNGMLREAERNLKICRLPDFHSDFVAKLELIEMPNRRSKGDEE